MPYDKSIANRLRDAGLKVKECDGWKNRGSSSFSPIGAVTHHTAGPPQGSGSMTPSLGICINGRPDLAGPLCNTYLGYDRVAYVVAAGRANHAGTPDGGNCRGMTGNTTAWGLEVEHPGTFPLPNDMAELAARIQAATIKGTADEDMVVYHKEWAPSRKIDLATDPSPNEHRERVRYYLGGGDMSVPAWFWDWDNWYLNTERDPNERPDAAPESIPEWAWDYNAEVVRISKNYGMTQNEQDWIVWYLNGRDPATRPDVPETIPDHWWDDMNFVQAQRNL